MFALGLTGLGAGGFDCRVNDLGVSLRGNFLLCNDDRVADRAMLALGLAGCGAGGFNCRVDDLGVSLRGNLRLLDQHLVTDRAMLALGLAGCGAGGGDCRVDDLGMALGRDFFLGNEYSIADGAVLAFGQTSLSAGWSLCCIDYFCVAGRRDFFHTGENRITNGALRTGCMTSLSAGCGLFSNLNGSVTGSSDCFCFGFIANRAGVGLDTGIFTGRSGRDHALIPLVSLRGNDLLLLNDIAANGTLDAVRQSGFGAGSCLAGDSLLFVSRFGNFLHAGEGRAADRALCAGFVSGLGAGCGLLGNFNGSMTGSIDCFCFGLVADRAGVGLDTGIFTSRSGRSHALVPAVSLRGNHCLCHENLIADGAMLALGLAGFGAGGFHCLVDDLGVSRCGNFCHVGFMTACAGAGLLALFRAGRGSRYSPFAPVMTKRETNLTVADLLIAVLAVGIAGISGLGASGGFRVTKFCVLMCARRAAPYAFDIVDNIASLGSLRLGVGAVGVVQLSGGDGD